MPRRLRGQGRYLPGPLPRGASVHYRESMIDRARLATLRADEEDRFVEPHPRSAGWRRAGPLPAGRRPDAVDDALAGRVPGLRRLAPGARLVDVDGLEYVDLCLGDTGAMTGHALPAVTEAVAERVARRDHRDAAVARRRVGRRGAGPAVRAAALAARDVGDRREPVRAPLRPSPHRPAAGRGDGLVLPRHRRRDPGRARRRPASCRGPGALGPQVDVAETTAVVPFNDARRARRAAGPGRRRLPADGAGADQHRDRAARRGLLGGGPRDHPPARRAAGDRRDAHAVRRPRWLHGRVGAGARPAWSSASRSAAASPARRTA